MNGEQTLGLDRERHAEQAPLYHTLSSADPTLAAHGPLVRIAFDATVSEAAAHGIAKQVAANILAGPSPENVYTFVFEPAPGAGRNLDDIVASLRREAHVLLVEPVALGPRPAGR